jgi:cytochrome c peroxidase
VLSAMLCVVIAACAGDGHGTVDPLSGDPALFQWNLPEGFPPPPVPADNPMSAAKVELGRRLFYDTRLSGNGAFSCASCHRQEFAFADARNVPVGSTGEAHTRNSMALANVAYFHSLGWADPLTARLEVQALIPMFGDVPVELGLKGREADLIARLRAEPVYQPLFPKSFPEVTDPFTVPNVTKALAAFQRTFLSLNAPYDRYRRGEVTAISASARRGELLFFSRRTGCVQCHSGALFTLAGGGPPLAAPAGILPPPPAAAPDEAFFNTGLYNLSGGGSYPLRNRGLFEITGRAEDMGRMKVPSLRNVSLSFPYMHDGSVGTLEDVVDHYARGGRLIGTGPNAGDGSLNPFRSAQIRPFPVSAGEKADLVAFLRALTDSSFVTSRRLANPWR